VRGAQIPPCPANGVIILNRFAFRSADRHKAINLYGAVVTQARDPALFTRLGVSDTPHGRYEMLVLHLALVLERLRAAGLASGNLSRDLVEVFVTDMDDNMREMGVGDLSVPKRVKRAAGGLYDRTLAYRAALDRNGVEPLAELLREHVFEGRDEAGRAARLADHVLAAHRRLSETDAASVMAGRLPARGPDEAHEEVTREGEAP